MPDSEQANAQQGPADSRGRRALRWCLVALPLAVFLWSGWRGIDFGDHWDAGHRVLDLTTALQEQTLLPEEYNYPSMTFWLTVAAITPEAFARADLDSATREFEGPLAQYVYSPEFQIRCRLLFLLVSSLSILWIFAASLAWRNKPWEALLAACFVAGSFEVGYHSRWVAPDAVLMQFGALSLLACVCALRDKQGRGWLTLAVIAAGMAAGTKYTGGIFLLPVLFVTWHARRNAVSLLRAVAIFGATFLVTTPGVLLEPTKFLEDVVFEFNHYAEGHIGFSVDGGWDHFTRNMRYLIVAGPSRAPLVSLLISVLGVLGVVGLWRDSKPLAFTVLLVPVLFVPYISSQSVMFVRNLIPLMPVAALVSARGAGLLFESIGSQPARAALGSAIALVTLFNLGLALQAAETVHGSDEARLFAGMDAYFAEHPEQVIQLSPNVRTGMKTAGFEFPANVRRSPAEDARFLATFRRELRTRGYWPSNDPQLVEAVIGPLSANYDYYSTWWAPHLIVMDLEKAREIAALYPPPAIEHIFPDLVAIPPPAGVLEREEQERQRALNETSAGAPSNEGNHDQ